MADSDTTVVIPTDKPKRKKRRWTKVLLVVFVLIVLLVVLAPQIASMGMVRRTVLGQVNGMVAGKVEIDDWTISWGGIEVQGLRVLGVAGEGGARQTIVSVKKAELPAHLLDLARQNFDLGHIKVDGVRIAIETDKDGVMNLLAAVQPPQAAKPAAAAPGPKPAGPIEPAKPAPAQPTAQARTAKPAISLPNVNLWLTLTDIQISAKQPGLAASLAPSADVKLTISGGSRVELEGTAKVENITASGTSMSGDTFLDKQISVTIPKTVIDLAAMSVQVGTADGAQAFAVASDFGGLKAWGTIPLGEVMSAIEEGKAIATESSFHSTGSFDVAKLTSQLPHVVSLKPGIAISKLSAFREDHLTFGKTGIVVASKQGLTDLEGTEGGKAFTLKGISFAGGGTIEPRAGATPAVKKLDISLDSPFADLKLGGEELKRMGGAGKLDMAALQTWLERFLDLKGTQLEGLATLKLKPETTTSTDGKEVVTHTFAVGCDLTVSTLAGTKRQYLLNHAKVALGFQTQAAMGPDSQSLTVGKFSLDAFDGAITGGSVGPNGIETMVAPVLQVSTDRGVTQASWDLAISLNVSKLKGIATALGLPYRAPNIKEPSVGVFTRGSVRGENGTMVVNALLGAPQTTISMQNATLVTTRTPLLMPETIEVKAKIENIGELISLATELGGAFAKDPMAQVSLPLPLIPVDIPGGAVAMAARPLSDALGFRAEAGALDATLTMTRAGQGEGIVIEVKTDAMANGKPLTLHVGNEKYVVAPTRTQIKADYSVDAAGALTQARVNELSALLGPLHASLEKPIVVGFGKTMTVDGTIAVDGNIEEMGPLADLMQGQPAGTLLPMTGKMKAALTPKITDVIGISATASLTDLKGHRRGKVQEVLCDEPLVTLGADLAFDPVHMAINIAGVTVKSPSGMADVAITGAITDLSGKPAINKLTLALNGYDLERVWKLLYTVLPAEMQETLKDMKLSGKHQGQFVTVNGVWDSTKPMSMAILGITADASVALGRMEFLGFDLQKAELPIMLRSGIISIAGSKPYVPATLNGGSVNLGGITVDMTKATPELNIPKGQQLVKNVKLNPEITMVTLGQVTPLFSQLGSVEGTLEMTSRECRNIPMGLAFLKEDPANPGMADFLFSIQGLKLGYKAGSGVEFVQSMIDLLPQKQGAMEVISIENANVKLARGVLDHEIRLKVKDQVIALKGSAGLETKNIQATMSVPKALIPQSWTRISNYPQVQKAWEKVGDPIVIPIEGKGDNARTKYREVMKDLLMKELQKIGAGFIRF